MDSVQDSTAASSKTYLVTTIAMVLGVLNHLIFITIFYIYDITLLYYYNYISIAIFLALLVTVIKQKTITLVMILASIEILVHQVLAVSLLGWDYGFQYYIIAIPGLVLLGDFKYRSFPIATSLLSGVTLIFIYFYSLTSPPVYQLEEIKAALYLFNLISVAALVAVFNGLFAYFSRQHEAELLNAHEQLYITATTDSMTKLANRMKTFDLIKDQIVRAKRTGQPFTLAISDIDDFKEVNDNYGHIVGDEVIISIAQLMKNSLREQDIIGRWGGEEFMIVLPDTKITAGEEVLEKLRKNVSSYPVKTDGSSINITITLGAAESTEAETITDIIKHADDALYKGKRGTKNCTVLSRDIK
jgi:diguanylate cyclase (GGDEF)-like protein